MNKILNDSPLSFRIDMFITYALPHLLLLPIFALHPLSRKEKRIDEFENIFRRMLGKWMGAP
jgi:hypothetical protein